jgi:DNA-binding NtrC family response regulator
MNRAADRNSGARDGNAATPDSRIAVLVGFSQGLEDALHVMLTSSACSVVTIASPNKAIKLLETRHVDVVVVSARCPIAAVVRLTESFGRPRKTRVVVLLAGHDAEAERRYRKAGLQYVMHMPVNAEDLLQVVRSNR